MPVNPRACPTEHQDQQALVAWAGFQRVTEGLLGDFLLMIPNESLLSFIPPGPRRYAYWNSLKKLGFRKGASDLLLSLPRNGAHGLYLEMKRERKSFATPRAIEAAVSDEQVDFLARMISVGYRAVVAYGYEEGKAAITGYLGPPPDESP